MTVLTVAIRTIYIPWEAPAGRVLPMKWDASAAPAAFYQCPGPVLGAGADGAAGAVFRVTGLLRHVEALTDSCHQTHDRHTDTPVVLYHSQLYFVLLTIT